MDKNSVVVDLNNVRKLSKVSSDVEPSLQPYKENEVILFYAGILPVKVDVGIKADLLEGKPFDGCRTYEMYTPFNYCAHSASFELMCQMVHGTDTYSEVFLPMFLREIPDKGSYYSDQLDHQMLEALRPGLTDAEKTALYLWLDTFFYEHHPDFHGSMARRWLVDWVSSPINKITLVD